MAKLIVGNEIANIIKQYRQAAKSIDSIGKAAVYKGAGYMADAVKREIRSISVVDDKSGRPPYVRKGKKLTSISSIQKNDLLNSFGISKFDSSESEQGSGQIAVKLGFDGYGSYPTRKHLKGIPNQLLIRSLEKGTSFLKKNNVVTRTVNQNKNKVEKIIVDNFYDNIKKEL